MPTHARVRAKLRGVLYVHTVTVSTWRVGSPQRANPSPKTRPNVGANACETERGARGRDATRQTTTLDGSRETPRCSHSHRCRTAVAPQTQATRAGGQPPGDGSAAASPRLPVSRVSHFVTLSQRDAPPRCAGAAPRGAVSRTVSFLRTIDVKCQIARERRAVSELGSYEYPKGIGWPLEERGVSAPIRRCRFHSWIL